MHHPFYLQEPDLLDEQIKILRNFMLSDRSGPSYVHKPLAPPTLPLFSILSHASHRNMDSSYLKDFWAEDDSRISHQGRDLLSSYTRIHEDEIVPHIKQIVSSCLSTCCYVLIHFSARKHGTSVRTRALVCTAFWT